MVQGEDTTILQKFSEVSVIRRYTCHGIVSALRTHSHFLNICAQALEILGIPRRLVRAMLRTLAPLRRIVSRELEIFSYDRTKKDLPQSFAIHDRLECGHIETLLAWDVFDLLNPYTKNPEVKARRHRCRPCAQLLATRKPVQSIGLTAIAGKGVA